MSADLPGMVERIAFESGSWVREGDVLAAARHAAGARAAGGGRGAARARAGQLRAHAGAARRARRLARRVRSRHRRRPAERRARRRDPRDDRAQDDPRAVLGRARHPSGQPRTVPGGRRRAGRRCSRSIPIYVNFGVPQQAMAAVRPGRAVRVTATDGAAADVRPAASRRSTRWSTRRRATSRCRRRSPIPAASCGPACSCRPKCRSARRARVISLPASAISYAPYGDSVFVVADLKDPNGRVYRGVRQQFVKLGPARGDQVAVAVRASSPATKS